MRPLQRPVLPAFLIAALSVFPPAAFAIPVRDRIDSRPIVTFVTGADEKGKKYVADGVALEPIEAIIRAWIDKTDRIAVEELDVAVRSSLFKSRMRHEMAAWAEDGGKIKRASAVSDTSAFLIDAAAKAHKLLQDPRSKAEINESINANDGAPTVPDSRQTVERARKLREKQHGDKGIFGRDRDPGEPGGGGGSPPPPEGTQPRNPDSTTPPPTGDVKTQAQIQALADELNAAQRAGQGQTNIKLRTGGAVDNVEFQALGSVEVAPPAGVLDKASSLRRSDTATIVQDQATIRTSLKDAELPTVPATNEGNVGAIAEFFRWLQNAKPEDMPTIDYAILPAGEVGTYELGLLSKGTITLNHFIRDAEPRARSAVLVHELYHYWDKKVAKNPYANVSYGYIDPASKHTHEYDAYLATSQYWAMVRQEGDNSPLARLLERIPTEAEGVKKLVNGIVGVGK